LSECNITDSELSPPPNQPILFLHLRFLAERQDPAVGYRDAWPIIENYPRASFVVLDRSEHGTTPQHAELFKILIQDCLDRVEEVENLQANTP
jgi:hypothetical protein